MCNCCCNRNRCCCNQENNANVILVDYIEGFPTTKVHDLNPCIGDHPCPPPPPPPPPVSRVDLTILKTDAVTGAWVSGAVFQLVGANGLDTLTATSTPNGIVHFRVLPDSEYTLTEIIAAPGYEPINISYSIMVDENGLVYVNGVYTPQLTIQNTPSSASNFSFNKVNDAGAPVSGAVFTLYQNGVTVEAAGSDAFGSVVFSTLTPGTYTMQETQTPAGYQPNPQVYTVVISMNGTVTINGVPASNFSVVNTVQTGVPVPVVNQPINAGDVFVSGMGVPGNTIMITWPVGSTPLTSTAVVDASGVWTIAVPGSISLAAGNTVTAVQYAGVSASDPVGVVVV